MNRLAFYIAPYSYKLRDAVKSGDAEIVKGLRKHKFIYEIVK